MPERAAFDRRRSSAMKRLGLAALAALALAVAPAFGAAPPQGRIDTDRPDCGQPGAAACGRDAPDSAAEDGTAEWMAVSTAFQAYDYGAALLALAPLAARQPFNADIAFMRGYAHLRRHDFPEAIAALDHAVSLEPSHGMALAHRGLARALSGDAAQGLADMDASLALVAENPAAVAYKGLILTRTGKADEGLALMEDAAAMASEFVWPRLVRATALADLKRLDDALADAEKAVAAAPDDPSVYTVRARVRLDRRDPPAAIADIEKARSLGGQDPFLIVLRGRARAAAGDPRGAIEDLAVLNRQYPGVDAAMKADLPSLFGDGYGDPLPRLMLAVLKIERGDARGARAIAEQVLLTAPWARPSVLMVRAYASQALGDHERALADLDDLEAELGPSAESRYIRAKVLWARGSRTEALASIDAAVATSGDDPLYLQTQATFRYETGDLAGALPGFAALRGSDEYGDWAWEMQILTLYFLDRTKEAGEQALPYLKADKPADDTLRRVLADTVWRLQAGDDWALADRLLAVTRPPPLGEDFDLFLKARSAAHAGRQADAAALLARIGAHDVLLLARSDAVFAPLWDAPALQATFDLSAMYRRSFERAWQDHDREPRDLLAAAYALGVMLDMGCGEAASEAATRFVGSLSRYDEHDRFGAAIFQTIGVEALLRGDGAGALAAWDEGIDRLGADNPYALTLTLNAAFLMAATGRHEEAIRRLDGFEAISPAYEYGIAAAQQVRALAYDALGRTAERDKALDGQRDGRRDRHRHAALP